MKHKTTRDLLRTKIKVSFKARPEILLCPQVPPPLHGVNPRTVMGEAQWSKVRQAVYRSTGYHCAACGVHRSKAKYHQWLEAHELYTIDYAAGRMTLREIIPLCHSCHNFIHVGRMKMLVLRKQMPLTKYKEIVSHGESVLKKAGLQQKSYGLGTVVCAPWSKWRLVYKGKEYSPLHKTMKAWEKFYKE